jgi:hypothetical protein
MTHFVTWHYFLLDWYLCGLALRVSVEPKHLDLEHHVCHLYRNSKASPSVTPLDATSHDQSPEKKTLPNLPFLINLDSPVGCSSQHRN